MSDEITFPSSTTWTGNAQWFPERPAWMQDAECRGLDPNVFFTERGEPTTQVKEICARCPVRGECLDYALEMGEKFGCWGGTSERERRRLRAARGRRPGVTVDDARRRQVQQMHDAGLHSSEIARDLGLSRGTVLRYLKARAS
jgi:WhiB family redox-sensing transcriptional regulator